MAKLQGRECVRNRMGSGRNGLRKQRRVMDGSSALSKPALRRLARRAGVKRINSGFYEEATAAMRSWLSKILADCVTLADHGKRFTVTINDVDMALKRNGMTLYGLVLTQRRRKLTRHIPRQSLVAAAQRVAARRVATPEIPAAPQPAVPSQVQLTAAKPTAAQAEPESEVPVPTEERTQDIQTALAAFFRRHEGSSVNTVLQWINGHMRGRNKPACSSDELDVILEGLEGHNAVLLDTNEETRQKMVYCCF